MSCMTSFLCFGNYFMLFLLFNLGDKYDTALIKSENYTSGHSSLTRVLGMYLMLLENLKVNFIVYSVVLLWIVVKMANKKYFICILFRSDRFFIDYFMNLSIVTDFIIFLKSKHYKQSLLSRFRHLNITN